jgi:ethanolamine utilization microcompartment shell protein EutL
LTRRFASRLVPIALVAPAPTLAQGAAEAAIKAAFLVKFGAYVEWPRAEGPVTICVVGRDPLGDALNQAVSGQQINDRPVTVRRLYSVAADSGCAIAYLVGSPRQSVPAALAALRSAPVLTVTDGRWNSARGMIHFQIASNRVRFHVDDRAAAAAGLGISSKLMALALSVRTRGR